MLPLCKNRMLRRPHFELSSGSTRTLLQTHLPEVKDLSLPLPEPTHRKKLQRARLPNRTFEFKRMEAQAQPTLNGCSPNQGHWNQQK
jgi:hypothetical protein